MTTTLPSAGAMRSTRLTGTLLRSVIGIVLAVSSALLLLLAFPPYGAWPLIWVGFVPMLLAQHRVLPARLSSLAPAITLGGFFGAMFGPVFAGLPEIAGAMAWLPLAVGVLVFGLQRAYRPFHARTHYRWLPLHSTLSWVAITIICSLLPFTGTWPMLANALYSQPWLLQPVSVVGVFGLELLIMAVNSALGMAALALFDWRWALDADRVPLAWPLARRWLLGVGLVALAWVGLSAALLQEPAGPTVRVAAIQPNREALLTPADRAQPSGTWWARVSAEIWPQLVAQTREAASQGAQLIVWPEAALSDDPRTAHTAELIALARETRAYLAIPYTVDGPAGHRNEVTVLSPDGLFLGVYGKQHPLVFAGETSATNYGQPVYDTPIGRLATVICYDLDFLDTARATAANGAQLVAVPAGDWPAIATLHYTHVVLRAVENRVAMVMAEWSFDSAIIDPHGRIVAQRVAPGGARATLVADVPLGSADAPAIRLGDLLGWLAIGGLIAFAVGIPLSARRASARPANQATHDVG